MERTMKKIVTLLMVLLFSSMSAMAGDLYIDGHNFQPVITVLEFNELIINCGNKNTMYSVTGINYDIKVYEVETGVKVFSNSIAGNDAAPNSQFEVNLGRITPANRYTYGYTYRVEVEATADFDEDLSNNKIEFVFEYQSRFSDLEKALALLYGERSDLNKAKLALVHKEKVPAGTTIKSNFEDISLKVNSESYVGWIDLMPDAYYSHPTILYSYDIEKDELNTMDANWYPIIMDSESNELMTNDVLVYGEEPEIPSGSSDIFIGTGEGQMKKERVCAVLVSGTDLKKKRIQDSFIRNVDLMKTALKNNLSNTGLTDENIRVEHGISGEALYNILVSMVGKYDKIYFYYSGHMTKQGLMLTGKNTNEAISGQGVIEAISDIGAKDNCIVWESCYSGLMVEEVSEDFLFEKTNVSIFTSSSKDNQSFANYLKDTVKNELIGYGAFTFNFTKCYQDSSADTNKDKMVSLSEAYNWLKSNKPKDSNGRDIDSLQGFRSKVKSNGKKDGAKSNISFEGTGVVIYDVGGTTLDEDYTVSVSVGEHDLETTNNKITEISDSRMWNIESTAENGKFNVSLEVQLDTQYEMLTPELPSIIGMVWREDDKDDWKPQYPSVYNKDDNTITCPNVDHFSQWAAGVVSANPTSVDSKFLINNVEYGPNPFKNMMNFEFNLDKPESFSIEVVDITGRRFDFINSQDYGEGTFSVNLDGSKYPSGTYYCRLISESGIRTIKLVKE
jgi:hypothetical protein